MLVDRRRSLRLSACPVDALCGTIVDSTCFASFVVRCMVCPFCVTVELKNEFDIFKRHFLAVVGKKYSTFHMCEIAGNDTS